MNTPQGFDYGEELPTHVHFLAGESITLFFFFNKELIMELNVKQYGQETVEIETTEVAADDVRELNSLELALVGGAVKVP
jgi:hypothetical protein